MVGCAVVGCNIRSDRKKSNISLFSIPKIVTREGEAHQRLTEKRRKLWLSRINREDLNESNAKPWTRVCGRHFVSGSPSALYDESSADWAPSLHLGYNLNECCYRSEDMECQKMLHQKKHNYDGTPNYSDTTEEDHHAAGGPVSRDDESNQVWTPSLNLGYNMVECCYRGEDNETAETPTRKKCKFSGTWSDNGTAEEQQLDAAPHPEEDKLQTFTKTSTVNPKHSRNALTQTDLTRTDLKNLEEECKRLRSKLFLRRKKVLRAKLSEEAFQGPDIYSNFPSLPVRTK